MHDGAAHVFYMDIRSGGKNYDEFVRRAIEEDGAHYHRGRVSKITEENGRLVVRGVDTLVGEPLSIEADMVGMERDERLEFLQEMGLEETGLNRIIAATEFVRGGATRALAHATQGPCLQQNLVAIVEQA